MYSINQQHGLITLLEQKNCFKLICGAGNQNLDEVEKLVAVYAKAGCHFFDFAADEEVLKAAQKGLDFSIPKEEQKNYYFCISIGTKGDQHVQKAHIDNQKCTSCGKCIEICPQKAIEQTKVNQKLCIGCMKCKSVCEFNAISFHFSHLTFHSLITSGFSLLTCVELHASDTDEKEVDEIWQYLNENFDGILSLCLGRKNLSDERILNRVKRLVGLREPYTTIIQADGIPMSGNTNNFETTLPAVEMGKFIQSANLPVYLILSGGTNSKTAESAKKLGVNINGVAVGSYARKIVKKYIEKPDSLKNKTILEDAVKEAKTLIKSLDLK